MFTKGKKISLGRKKNTSLSNEKKDYETYLKSNGVIPQKNEEEMVKRRIKGFSDSKSSKIEEQKKTLTYKELDLCNNYLNLHSNNLYAIERRAKLYSATARYNDAISDYNFLMRNKPKNFFYVKNCAVSYAHIDDFTTAFNLINNFYKNKKLDAQYYSALGEIYEIIRDFDFAIKNYSEAIKLDPYNELAYLGRANIYFELDDEEKYLSEMRQYENIYRNKFHIKLLKQNMQLKYNFCFKKRPMLKIAVLFFVLLLIAYLYPTKEEMYCSSSRTCTVERTHLGIFKTNKEIKLNSNTRFNCSIHSKGRLSRRRYHHVHYRLYIDIDSIAPFFVYIEESRRYRFDLNETCNMQKRHFYRYLTNYRNQQYRISSKANWFELIGYIFASLFILLLSFHMDDLKP